MKRVLIVAGALGLALLAAGLPAVEARTCGALDDDAARIEAASYLASSPRHAELVADHWVVSDGADTATLDARTGELVEIQFASNVAR
jgi:hypothetical protein